MAQSTASLMIYTPDTTSFYQTLSQALEGLSLCWTLTSDPQSAMKTSPTQTNILTLHNVIQNLPLTRSPQSAHIYYFDQEPDSATLQKLMNQGYDLIIHQNCLVEDLHLALKDSLGRFLEACAL